jgi:hypothetical protein
MAINLRSPYYQGTSTASTAYTTMAISIWEGSSASPVTAQYNLKKSVVGSSVKVYFEISELIKDYLDVTFDGDYVGKTIWVRTVRTPYNSSDSALTSPLTTTSLAYDSYSYFENPSFNIDDNPLLISNREMFVLDDNAFRVPINTLNNPTVTFFLNNEVVSTQSFTTSLLSSEQIKYVSIYGDSTNYDNFKERVLEDGGTFEDNLCLKSFLDSLSIGKVDKITVLDDNGLSATVLVNTIDECKYEPKKVSFINRFGVLQDMYFFKKAVEKITIKKSSYKSHVLDTNMDYSINTHVNRDFNINGDESITLSSGYLSEEYNQVFKELMLSEKVWVTNVIESGEQVLPINVKTSNITYKTSLNDKLVEYSIEFDNSFNVINNIR